MSELLVLTILFVAAFIISCVATSVIRSVAIRKRLLDRPKERSFHERITPLGGGGAIVVTWFIVLMVLLSLGKIENQLFLALLPGALLFLVGIIDDKKELSPKVRLVAQVVVCAWSFYLLGGVSSATVGKFVFMNSYILNVLAFVLMVWFVNLFNFYDGIDGNLGTETIVICLIVSLLDNDTSLLFLVPCVLGFLVWNWQKAKIFMGDAGSTFLGFNFAVYGIYYQSKWVVNDFMIQFDSYIHPVLWLMICGLIFFDTTYTLIRRIIYRENVFLPHKNHIFHRLTLAGFSHQKTVLVQQCLNIGVVICVLAVKCFPSYLPVIAVSELLMFLIYAYIVERMFPFVRMKE